jgi:hypothetical protein
MKTIKEVLSNYNDELYGIDIVRNKQFPKQIELKGFWGSLTIYEKIRRELLREGYTVFG